MPRASNGSCDRARPRTSPRSCASPFGFSRRVGRGEGVTYRPWARLEGRRHRRAGADRSSQIAARLEHSTRTYGRASRSSAARAVRGADSSGAVGAVRRCGVPSAIACANVANLLLARSTARRRESHTHCVGASRVRVARQLLTESVLLALAGGGLGLLLAWWGVGLRAVALSPRDLVDIGQVKLDLPVLGFNARRVAADGVVFGVAPALRGRAARRGRVAEGRGEGRDRRSPEPPPALGLRRRRDSARARAARRRGPTLRSFVRLRSASPASTRPAS